MLILNEAVANNWKVMLFRKRSDKRLSDIYKKLIFAASAVLEVDDWLILLAHNENKPPNLRKVMGHTLDSVTLVGRAHKKISVECKEHLRPVWQENFRFKISFWRESAGKHKRS